MRHTGEGLRCQEEGYIRNGNFPIKEEDFSLSVKMNYRINSKGLV